MSRRARSVPLGRRNLFADGRRLAASAVAVGLAVMLILLLAGLWAGIRAQATLYEDHTGAQLYVVSPGTQGLFTDGSRVSRRDVALARCLPGVPWAAPVRTGFAILDLHGKNELATSLHRDQHAHHAEQQLRHMVQGLLVDAAETGEIRDDIPPGELATYCLHALSAASSLPTKTAVRRLVMVTLNGLEPRLGD